MALQVPKTEYLVSLVDEVYCAPGINNTETCKILLDADQQLKDDYAVDFANDTRGINSSIENRWTNHSNNISAQVYNRVKNDSRIGNRNYTFYNFDTFAFKRGCSNLKWNMV